MTKIRDFNDLIAQRIKELIPVQTVWAICKTVSEQDKTMNALGVTDDLMYHNVYLGDDDNYAKPEIGSKVLIGKIENQDANFFLINARAIVEFQFKSGNALIKLNPSGLTVSNQNENLKKVLNDMIDELNKIIVVQGTSINVPAMQAIKQRLNTVLND
jgi:hypothetical protein